MLLSIPPRPPSKQRLTPGLSLCAGDLLARRYRALSLLRADRACAHLAAVQTGTNTRVEVQVLLAMDDGIEAVHLRFLADARKAAALRGPHVDRVLHVGVTEDGHPFVVREPSSDQTLSMLLEKMGSLPTESAVDVAIAICEALGSAHAVGLQHGELDPTMVHLGGTADAPTNIKIAGLGTSRALAMLPFDGRSLVSAALRAPELLLAEGEIDARADIYAVGVLLYTMLAGATPFGADSPSKRDLSATGDEPALLAGVPDGLAEIVDACLARDPALRPQTAASLSARLALFGARPVFEKRSSLLVISTGPYDAVELEQLVKEAGPSEPSVDVDVDVDVEIDLIAPRAVSASRATGAGPVPAPLALTPSVPPVSITSAPPPLAQHAPSRLARKWRATALVAAACMGIGGVVGGVALQRSSSAPSGRAFAAVEAPPAANNDPAPAQGLPSAPKVAPARAGAPPAALPPTLAVADLPAATPRPRGRPLAPGGKPRAPSPAPKTGAPAAEPTPAVDPIAASASAPMQPQPKAPDDDLRRFLDDRR